MLSVIRCDKRRVGGYTLLEVAIVVAIIVMIIGAVVPLTSGYRREQKLRDVVREVLVMAKTARNDAMTQGQVAEIIFDKNGFALRRPRDKEPSQEMKLPKGMKYVLIPFATKKAVKPEGQHWVFQPGGLTEPLRVRIEDDDAWMEVSFDPLTAGIDDESYHIP